MTSYFRTIVLVITSLIRIFQLILNDQAVTDTPCVNYYKELLEAYPEAKVILTTRDPYRWIKSVERSIRVIINFYKTWPRYFATVSLSWTSKISQTLTIILSRKGN